MLRWWLLYTQVQSWISVAGASLLSIPTVPGTPRALPLAHERSGSGWDGSIELSLLEAYWGQRTAMQCIFVPVLCTACSGCEGVDVPCGSEVLGLELKLVSGDAPGHICTPTLG